jgi:toxin ParE1/3/4
VTYTVIVLPQAKDDARDIDHYLAERSSSAADRFTKSLQSTIELQASIPTPGIPWPSYNPALAGLRWTRVKGFPKYLLFLRTHGNVMEIIRILHSSRDLDALLPS